MCGICGFTWDDASLLKRMMARLAHRGPDDSGKFTFGDISLGHQRLSIIDLSPKGRQPMTNEDGTVWLSYNGEIYNYKELRKDLINKGHVFSSDSDTEVIVHGYEEYGIGILSKLNGFFGLAIWDAVKKRLVLARDRLGIKPIYYHVRTDGEIIFASEIKAILESPIKRSVDVRALHDFLSFRCVSIENTMFDRIRKLMPGHFLVKDKDGIKVTKYWDVSMDPGPDMSERHHADTLRKSLEKSVHMRLMSDVPIGAYLSGGIDSGTVVGLMDQAMDEEVKTFSVGFGLDEHEDELRKARLIADHFSTDHQEIIVDPNTVKTLPKIVWHLDEPMSDPTCIPTYLLSEQAKKKCTVILTGEGADEQLAGYSQYKMMLLHQKYARIFPRILRKAGASTARLMPENMLNSVFKYAGALGEKGLDRFQEFAGTDDYGKQYLSLVSIFNEYEKKELFTDFAERRARHIDIHGRLGSFFHGKRELLNSLLHLETKTLLAENLLMKVDKNTMAFGIEARVPFLDHNVVENSFRIPQRLKLNGMTEKYILRKAMADLLPKETLEAKKERFFVPIDTWMKGEMMDVAKQLLSQERNELMGLFKQRYIENAFRNYKKSSLFYARQLWSLMSFSIWHKTFIEQDKKVLR